MHWWSFAIALPIAIAVIGPFAWRDFKTMRPYCDHVWHVAWYMGNVWTECERCWERRQIPAEDLSEMPPSYPIEPHFRHRSPEEIAVDA